MANLCCYIASKLRSSPSHLDLALPGQARKSASPPLTYFCTITFELKLRFRHNTRPSSLWSDQMWAADAIVGTVLCATGATGIVWWPTGVVGDLNRLSHTHNRSRVMPSIVFRRGRVRWPMRPDTTDLIRDRLASINSDVRDEREEVHARPGETRHGSAVTGNRVASRPREYGTGEINQPSMPIPGCLLPYIRENAYRQSAGIFPIIEHKV